MDPRRLARGCPAASGRSPTPARGARWSSRWPTASATTSPPCAARCPGAQLVVQLDEPSPDRRCWPGGCRPRPATAGSAPSTRSRPSRAWPRCCAPSTPPAPARCVHSLRAGRADRPARAGGRRGAEPGRRRCSTPAAGSSSARRSRPGLRLWAGRGPDRGGSGAPRTVRAGCRPTPPLADAVRRPWRRVGLPAAGLRSVVVTPTCGLAGASPTLARLALTRAVGAARALADASYDD